MALGNLGRAISVLTTVFTTWCFVNGVGIIAAILLGGMQLTGNWVCPSDSQVEVDLQREQIFPNSVGLSPKVTCVDGSKRINRSGSATGILIALVVFPTTLLTFGAFLLWHRRSSP